MRQFCSIEKQRAADRSNVLTLTLQFDDQGRLFASFARKLRVWDIFENENVGLAGTPRVEMICRSTNELARKEQRY